jgi:hypothetical protein
MGRAEETSEEGRTIAEKAGPRGLLSAFADGLPSPNKEGLSWGRGPLEILSNLRCEGEEGGKGDDERSCSIRRTGSGDIERRFLG